MAQRRSPERTAATPAAPGKRPWWLIGLGLAAVAAFALATLPARLLRPQLARAGLEAATLTGSIWRGTAPGLAWRGTPIGDLRWTVSPWALLRGRLGGEIELTRPDGSLRTAYSASLGGELRLEDTQASLPVEALSALPLGVPRGWRGRLSGRLDELVLSGGWPLVMRGTLEMDGLIAPPPRSTSIGSYSW